MTKYCLGGHYTKKSFVTQKLNCNWDSDNWHFFSPERCFHSILGHTSLPAPRLLSKSCKPLPWFPHANSLPPQCSLVVPVTSAHSFLSRSPGQWKRRSTYRCLFVCAFSTLCLPVSTTYEPPAFFANHFPPLHSLLLRSSILCFTSQHSVEL